jgi:Lar family restriction alleviation protein
MTLTVNPCPFCGHVDVEFSEVEPGTIAVDCPECQCIGPFADSHDEAASKWNRAGAQDRQRAY